MILGFKNKAAFYKILFVNRNYKCPRLQGNNKTVKKIIDCRQNLKFSKFCKLKENFLYGPSRMNTKR